MDLKNGTITVSEILAHPEAFALLQEYFPQIAQNPLALTMAKNWSLRQVLQLAQANVPPQTVLELQQKLEAL